MNPGPAPVRCETRSGAAPDALWAEVVEVFVGAFSAAPYGEDPAELATIATWGPDLLAHRGGTLVTARSGAVLAGFALAQALGDDPSWERVLSGLADPTGTAADLLRRSADVLVVRELAVREGFRGCGTARRCLRDVVRAHPSADLVLGTYPHARSAAAVYRHWGFTDLGVVTADDGGADDSGTDLRVFTAAGPELLARWATG